MQKVLVVDDNNFDKEAIANAFPAAGYDTYMAKDGIDASIIYQKASPYIIITDILMPEKDGLELISHIRSKSKDAIVVAVSSGGEKFKIDYSTVTLLLGANKYFKKPVQPTLIVEYVKSELSARFLSSKTI